MIEDLMDMITRDIIADPVTNLHDHNKTIKQILIQKYGEVAVSKLFEQIKALEIDQIVKPDKKIKSQLILLTEDGVNAIDITQESKLWVFYHEDDGKCATFPTKQFTLEEAIKEYEENL